MIAFVLGGGGLLGASEVGMLRALTEEGVQPDLILGSSVGAINGSAMAKDSSLQAVARLADLWEDLGKKGVFSEGMFARLGNVARSRTYLHGNETLRGLIAGQVGEVRIEELPTPFQCVAACVETARREWFSSGSLVEAVLASSAVPGLLPPVEVSGRHYLDGGLVDSIPVGRAVELGADEVYVLQVGRIERPLTVPKNLLEVGMVSFEIARRNRFAEEMAALPTGVRLHLLPSGDPSTPLASMRYRDTARIRERMRVAYEASRAYLGGESGEDALSLGEELLEREPERDSDDSS